MGNPLLELMRRGESGAAGYNAFNRGTYTARDGREHIRPAGHAMDFSSLTLGQVMELQHRPRQDAGRVFAVGKYQIIPGAMNGAVRALHLRHDQPFTPGLQDTIFSDYLIARKRPAIHDYIVGKGHASLHKAQHALALEWASFGDPANHGRSHYGHGNRAIITLEQSAMALDRMRADYSTNIQSGMSPRESWAAVTKSGGGEPVAHVPPNIHPGKPNPLINEPGHPANAMYGQIKAECDRLGGQKALGFSSETQYVQALASMAWQARASGLTQVDHVVETTNRQNLVMIQGGLQDPLQQREVSNKAQAAHQTVEQSTRQLQQDLQQLGQLQLVSAETPGRTHATLVR